VISTGFSITAGSSALLFIAYLWGGTRLLAGLLSERDRQNLEPAWILLALVAVTPAALSALADVILIAANSMRLYAIRAATSGLLAVALTWLLTFHFGWGVAGALASYPIAAIFGLGLFTGWWRKQDDLGTTRVTSHCARALLRVGVQQHAISIIALVAKRVDVFLIASMLSLQDAGFYAAAILIPQAVVSIPRATMWPLVSSLPAGRTDVPNAVAQISRLQVLLMALMSLALFPLAPLIVTRLFGEAFVPSVAPFRWALGGLAFTPVTITVNAILTARSQPGLSIFSAVLGTGIQLILMILLIPKWGTSAGAAALSANFITTAVVQLVIVRSRGIRVGAMLIPRPADFADLARALRARVAP
jgi:O-antigen/teichoic acid export membrane protein